MWGNYEQFVLSNLLKFCENKKKQKRKRERKDKTEQPPLPSNLPLLSLLSPLSQKNVVEIRTTSRFSPQQVGSAPSFDLQIYIYHNIYIRRISSFSRVYYTRRHLSSVSTRTQTDAKMATTISNSSAVMTTTTMKKNHHRTSYRFGGRSSVSNANNGLRAAAANKRTNRVNIITRASGAEDIIIVDDASFEKEVLQSETPVLIDFWATWCGPCKLISKVVEKAAPEFKGNLKIVKIETDPNPILVEKYEVYGLPTLMVFKDGQPVKGSKREGAINLAKLKDYLQSHGISPA